MQGHDQDNAVYWDQRYAAEGHDRSMWSGRPNGSLVAEVADLPPGTALDVGCGEGADAIWLAQQGWQVTALDPSRVALDRAETTARAAEVEITWTNAGLLDLPGDSGPYDLVSAQYPVLAHTDDDAALATLLALVAPGGTLLFVHHDLDADHAHHHSAGEDSWDPADYVQPHDVAAHLDDRWEVQVNETRPRPGPLPAEARHVHDVVLRARRLR